MFIRNQQFIPEADTFNSIHSQWDILSNGGLVQELAHIANGRDPGNCVSLLRVNVSCCYNIHFMIHII